MLPENAGLYLLAINFNNYVLKHSLKELAGAYDKVKLTLTIMY